MSLEESIFGRALEFGSDEARRAFVEGACAQDRELSDRILKLLAASEGANDSRFLDGVSADLEAPIREGEGAMIGRYKLLQKIGEGGFGVVYMAEQKEPVRRRVALKIIKLGMDTKQVVGRFEAERQALAIMDHPNIAKVLDAGSTESGRPFFVMELVRGVHLMQFCDEQKLTPCKRLEVFVEICRAIQHAHQKGIIHRDLKPSNVIVTSDHDRPLPKVIDFGIAKATQYDLTDKTLFTRYEDVIGTPAYMSPEQAQYTGIDIDTRTDIYSLGVLLYELMVGSPPFDGKELMSAGVEELRRRLREDEPRRPSTHVSAMGPAEVTRIAGSRSTNPGHLGKMLRGELDWVILKAMDKDRQRRYATASELSVDIGRFLRGDAVEACPPSTVYRMRKLVRKHRFSIGIAAAIFGALTIGGMVATWQAIEASAANVREKAARQEAIDQLWLTYVQKAKLQRQSRTVGQHFGVIETVRKAASIKASMELRNEAIAAMALPDLRFIETLKFDQKAGFPVAMDPLGNRFAESDASTQVHLFSQADGQKLFSLPRHGGPIYYLSFSPDGQYLSVIFGDPGLGVETLKLWDLTERTVSLSRPNVEWRTDFDPKVTRISVLPRPNLVEIYDLESGDLLQRIPVEKQPHRAVFSPDGKQIAITSPQSSKVSIFDLQLRRERVAFDQKDNVFGICWGPMADQVFCATADFNVSLHDLPSGLERMEYRGHLAQVVDLEVPDRGNHLFTAGWDGYSRIWHRESDERLFEIRGEFSTISNDGRRVVIMGASPTAGVWEFSERSSCFNRFYLEGKPADKLVSLAFSPNGEWLVGGAAGGIEVWDLKSGGQVASAECSDMRSLYFVGNDSRTIEASGARGMHRWRLLPEVRETDQSMFPLDHLESFESRPIQQHVYSPDRSLRGMIFEGGILVSDAANGEKRFSLRGQLGVNQLAISGDHQWLASGCWKGRGVRVWNLSNPDEWVDLLENEDETVCAFSRDSQWLITGVRSKYQVRRVGDWTVVHELAGGGKPICRTDPTGQYLAFNVDDERIELWDAAQLKHVASFRPPSSGAFYGILFSPDGKFLALATSTRNVYVWNIPELRLQLRELGLDWDG